VKVILKVTGKYYVVIGNRLRQFGATYFKIREKLRKQSALHLSVSGTFWYELGFPANVDFHA